jgi:chloramphenicol-sensitive protein RarD
MTEATRGLLLALFCFSTWGSFPIFFNLLTHIPPTEVLVHRVVWSFLFVALILLFSKQWRRVITALRNPKLVLALLSSSLLIAINWGVYIWAVGQNRAVDASLGYFINPIVAVGLGVIFLKESLAIYQKVAILIASAGVLYKILGVGEFPWVALTLAVSFGFYGLVRKQAQVDTFTGLALETLLLLPLSLLYWGWLSHSGEQHFAINSDGLLLICSGVLTAIPLMAFSAAARRLSLTALGFLTYLTPTLQLLSAVFVLGEPFDQGDFVTFSLIWLALIVFSGGAIHKRQKLPQNA